MAKSIDLEPQCRVESLASLSPVMFVTVDNLYLPQLSHLSNGDNISPTTGLLS